MEILKLITILLILITVHEFGHFIVAKIFNVYVTEFALGFGPKIFSRKGKETEFTIRALPLGGYAAMVGEEGEISEELKDIPFERTLKGVNRFKQFLIMFAGSFMNLLLAFIIFIGIAATNDIRDPQAIIGSVSVNSPAYKAGVKAGDLVYEIHQGDTITNVNSYMDLSVFSSLNVQGKPFDLKIIRDNEKLSIPIEPVFDIESQRYIAGFVQGVIPKSSNPLDIIYHGWLLSVDTTKSIFLSLNMLISGQAGLNDLSGPVGMVEITKEVSDNAGLIGLINFTAILSINLAIFNLLPIPALDGGRIVIVTYESITRRRINPKVESIIIGFSFFLLMALIVVVTFNDITKIFRG